MNLRSEDHENNWGRDKPGSLIKNHNNSRFRSKLQLYTLSMMHIANFPWSLEFLYKFHKTHLTILIDPNVKSIYKENKEYGDITNKDEDGDEGKRPVGFERENFSLITVYVRWGLTSFKKKKKHTQIIMFFHF